MKHSRGFTLVEVLITLFIMVILMTLAVVSLRSSQAYARDEERKTDAESLARGFEQRYTKGNSRVIGWETKGLYPGINEVLHAFGANYSAEPTKYNPGYVAGGYIYDLLPGVTEATLRTPGSSSQSLGTTSGFDLTNATIRRSAIDNEVLNNSKYIYEPLDSNGYNCYEGGCRRFNLYYENEVTAQVRLVKSKNQ